MKRRLLTVVAVLVVALLVLAAIPLLQAPPAGRARSHVVISEVMFDPYGADAGKEWIELYNPGPGAQHVGGWQFDNRNGTLCTLPTMTMQERSYLLLCLGSVDDIDEQVLPSATVHSVELDQEVLSNLGDEIALSSGALSAVNIVDFVCWRSSAYVEGRCYRAAVEANAWNAGDFFDLGPTSGESMVAGFTMARDKDGSDTDRSQDWCRNGGRDAYFATPGGVNAAPYFSTADGIKMTQTKANQFFLQWGYDVINASHVVIARSEAWDSTLVIARHTFTVDVGGVELDFSGNGTYRWWRVSETLWQDNISMALDSAAAVPIMWLNYSRSYEDMGVEQTILERTECVELSLDASEASIEEPPAIADTTSPVRELYVSDCVTKVKQTGPTHYRLVVNDTRSLGYRDERQWLNFSKDYEILSDLEIEAWTRLGQASDRRPSMNISAHYAMISEVGWHRVNDIGEMLVSYYDYNMSYGEKEYQQLGEGRFNIDRAADDLYGIDWYLRLLRTDDGHLTTLDVGGVGSVRVSLRDGEHLYRGEFTALGQSGPVRFCIDGYESAIGGGVCAIAGGLIGSIFVGIGAVIGGGIGAAACGAVGYAIEDACEEDTTKPIIEIEITGQGSNKYEGWVDLKITVSDDNELDKVKYGSTASDPKNTWSFTKDPAGKSYTFTRHLWNAKCTESWRTVTVKAWDSSGNMAVKSQQIRVPPRDCTPNVQQTKPADKECCVPVNSAVTITFCKPMNTTSAESSVRTAPYFEYLTSWTLDNTTLRLTPLSALLPLMNYSVLITTEAKSCAEIHLPEPYLFWFTTADEFGTMVNVTYLPDDAVVHMPMLLLRGSISDRSGILLHGYSLTSSMNFVNMTFPGPPAPDVAIDWEIELAVGVNTIVVWTVNLCGHYEEVTRTVEFVP